MKKTIIIAVAFVLITTSLAGCGANNADSAVSENKESSLITESSSKIEESSASSEESSAPKTEGTPYVGDPTYDLPKGYSIEGTTFDPVDGYTLSGMTMSEQGMKEFLLTNELYGAFNKRIANPQHWTKVFQSDRRRIANFSGYVEGEMSYDIALETVRAYSPLPTTINISVDGSSWEEIQKYMETALAFVLEEDALIKALTYGTMGQVESESLDIVDSAGIGSFGIFREISNGSVNNHRMSVHINFSPPSVLSENQREYPNLLVENEESALDLLDPITLQPGTTSFSPTLSENNQIIEALPALNELAKNINSNLASEEELLPIDLSYYVSTDGRKEISNWSSREELSDNVKKSQHWLQGISYTYSVENKDDGQEHSLVTSIIPRLATPSDTAALYHNILKLLDENISTTPNELETMITDSEDYYHLTANIGGESREISALIDDHGISIFW